MSSKPNSNKSLCDIFDIAFETFSRNLCCVKIGEIQSFNPKNQTVEVKVLHKKENPFNLRERELIDYPPLQEVPVVILGGGGSRLTFPIKKGDNCLLLFNDFQLDGWWGSGESRPSDFPRKHSISDAIALVGVNSLVSLVQNYSDFVQLLFNDKSSIVIGDSVEVNNEAINLNGNTTVSGDILGQKKATAELHSSNGASGSFATSDGKTVTVVDGIITGIQ